MYKYIVNVDNVDSWRCGNNMKISKAFHILISSSEPVKHWWAQRLSAAILVPLNLWFIYSITFMSKANYETVTVWLSSKTNSILMLIFILIIYYHAVLGLQVIIEDYVATEWRKKILLFFVKATATIAALSALISTIVIFMEY